MTSPSTVVGIGEILWDLLPSGRQLGGAPANFAYCAHLLGDRGKVVSRIGNDDLGADVRNRLRESELSDEFVQRDPLHPTGTVNVEVDSAGQPKFEIKYPAAWDFIEWNGELEKLANSADAVCFGSLAQRWDASRQTILRFLDSTRNTALRILDVNLRQAFYSAAIITDSLVRASAVKLNDQELPIIAKLLGISEIDLCREMMQEFDLEIVCVTRAEKGSLLVTRSCSDQHPGFRVQVKDTVGAGDAFTAGLVHEFLRGSPLEKINDTANRMGAWVASCDGAMPTVPEGGLEKTLSELERTQA